MDHNDFMEFRNVTSIICIVLFLYSLNRIPTYVSPTMFSYFVFFMYSSMLDGSTVSDVRRGTSLCVTDALLLLAACVSRSVHTLMLM